nr:MAG TPA: hypothetical protein [Caudoviricetes sp.]DAT69720.1 MAG TPA: hypothetical protein [Caudoviricetes sp.]
MLNRVEGTLLNPFKTIEPLFTSILSIAFQQDFSVLIVSAVALEGMYNPAITESEDESVTEWEVVPSLTVPAGTEIVQENGASVVRGVTVSVVSQQIEDIPAILSDLVVKSLRVVSKLEGTSAPTVCPPTVSALPPTATALS